MSATSDTEKASSQARTLDACDWCSTVGWVRYMVSTQLLSLSDSVVIVAGCRAYITILFSGCSGQQPRRSPRASFWLHPFLQQLGPLQCGQSQVQRLSRLHTAGLASLRTGDRLEIWGLSVIPVPGFYHARVFHRLRFLSVLTVAGV
jgi:hypothetical protein